MVRVHRSITLKRIMDAVKRQRTTLDNPGFCVECGWEADGCEPDMRGGRCEHCGISSVYGAEELLMMVG
jgi:hypothetical protein